MGCFSMASTTGSSAILKRRKIRSIPRSQSVKNWLVLSSSQSLPGKSAHPDQQQQKVGRSLIENDVEVVAGMNQTKKKSRLGSSGSRFYWTRPAVSFNPS